MPRVCFRQAANPKVRCLAFFFAQQSHAMPWLPMEIERIRGGRGNLDEVRATTRFLLDNNTDLAVLLRHFDGIGVSTDELPGSLKRRGDEEGLAYAWQRDRVLLTHDDDFLDVRRHPWETNPGVVVMPGGSGDVA